MRTSHSSQARFDCRPVGQVELNFECRDEIIPILAALQHLYTQPRLRDEILRLVAGDVNSSSRADYGREGFTYWQVLVLAAVRLGCNFDYDRLQDLAENHRKLRHVMGIGDWDDGTSFKWRRIRDNICLLKPTTIARINELIVREGHRLNPEAARTARVDSFVVETNIHHPTESSLIWDGLRKVIQLCSLAAYELEMEGWRQHDHLLKKLRQLHLEISRSAASKARQSKTRLKKLYAKLLKRAHTVLDRAETLTKHAVPVTSSQMGQIEQIRVFIERTRQVADTAYRRVILSETVPNADKLFSVFEPHTQLYRRGKAGKKNQFGRLVTIYEDGAGFITHYYFMGRDEQDVDVAVPQTKIVQQRLGGAIEQISFDRGFFSEQNVIEIEETIKQTCLPKRDVRGFAEQMRSASVEFRAARKNHPGVESAIGALQSGNGLKRSRDRTEIGVERYMGIAILGRNLHTLGKLLVAQALPDALAARSKRKEAA